MSEMVERAAQAIVDTYNKLTPACVAYSDLPEAYRENARACARAVIEAMRVPTEAMENELNTWACCAGYVDKGWAAAIDKALES